jgi:hypothetical protein
VRPGLTVPLAIITTAVALTLPCVIGGVRMNDSFWIDWVWLDQFAAQLGSGRFYPRWLPLSHGGLGSPVFYYYPPLAFYLGSPLALAGFSTWASIVATFFAAYIISGTAMYWWLKEHAPSSGPLIGAIIYMAAPYHAFNFYVRGAVAEFVATAMIPLVMLGLLRLGRGRRDGFFIAALGYAALIGSHLPLALLASLFLIGPYALLQSRARVRPLMPIAAALAVGIGMAAIYLLPALSLEQYRDTAKLWHLPVLQPANWTFWDAGFRSSQIYGAVLMIAAALAVALGALIVHSRSRWAMFGLGCTLLAIGTVPILWSLPVLKSVQFPFRLLPVAEFALATGAALVPWRALPKMVIAVPLLITTGSIVTARTVADVPIEQLQQLHPDVPENLPPGQRPYTWPSRWALDIAAKNPRATFANGITTDPVFYFPAWEVTCQGRRVATFAAPDSQLLAYRGQNCTRRLGWTEPERIGAIISALALLLLIGLATRERLLRGVAARKDAREEVTE